MTRTNREVYQVQNRSPKVVVVLQVEDRAVALLAIRDEVQAAGSNSLGFRGLGVRGFRVFTTK